MDDPRDAGGRGGVEHVARADDVHADLLVHAAAVAENRGGVDDAGDAVQPGGDGARIGRVAEREPGAGPLDGAARAGSDVEPGDERPVGDESFARRPSDEPARAGDGDARSVQLH